MGKGYFYAEQLNAMGFHTIPVTSTSNGMLMLLRGHIDLMTEDSVVGKYLISTLLPGRDDEFGEIQAPLESESVYLLFSKKKEGAAELVKSFNKGLRKLKENGGYQRILVKHGLLSP